MQLLNNVDQFETLKKFYSVGGKVLSCPVISTTRGKEDIYCILQVSEPIQVKTEASPSKRNQIARLFQYKEEVLLQLIAKLLGMCIEINDYVANVQQVKAQHREFAQSSGVYQFNMVP